LGKADPHLAMPPAAAYQHYTTATLFANTCFLAVQKAAPTNFNITNHLGSEKLIEGYHLC
jgi:hypothetical protein